jgi:hypothetical protein
MTYKLSISHFCQTDIHLSQAILLPAAEDAVVIMQPENETAQFFKKLFLLMDLPNA